MRKGAFEHFQKVLILTSNRVRDAVVGVDDHILTLFYYRTFISAAIGKKL